VNPNLTLVAVDSSAEALRSAQQLGGDEITYVVGRVEDPLELLEKLRAFGVEIDEVMVSAWFVFHEVLGQERQRLPRLLTDYHCLAPQCGLLLGELFEIPTDFLSRCSNLTAHPEFMLVHELSGQKLIPISAWQDAIAASGWQSELFIGLDLLNAEQQDYYGSGIWYLK
jgi:hypothetical protein